jgi:hypothetical protein
MFVQKAKGAAHPDIYRYWFKEAAEGAAHRNICRIAKEHHIQIGLSRESVMEMARKSLFYNIFVRFKKQLLKLFKEHVR